MTAINCAGSLFRTIIPAPLVFFALAVTPGAAQEVRKVALNSTDTTSKYTQQHTVDVGDAPGHQLRVYEIHRVYGKDSPVIEGLRMKENWIRGMSDYVNQDGPGMSYSVYMMENGDRIFTRANFVSQSVESDRATLKNMSTATITGGTGKFKGIRGIIRSEINANPKSGFFESKGEMEYWIEK